MAVRSKYLEIKVGALVLAGAAILLFAVYLAQGYKYGQKFYSVRCVFPEVGALSTGDPVTVSGVNMGKVTAMELYEGEVLVTMNINQSVTLKRDASFMVRNIGLMGERFIDAKAGKAPEELDLSQPARGDFDAGIPEVMGMLGEAIEQMRDLVTYLRQSTLSPATLDKFSSTITHLHELSTRLDEASSRNIGKIDKAVNNVVEITTQISQSMDRNRPHMDTALANFDRASERLLTLMDVLDDTSGKLQAFATDLEQSEGTLRLMMEDRQLYDDLRRTTLDLDSLIGDIRANPKKYINFTVEIF